MDIHHIDPWSKRREHQFENLIALCPNCHRRADAGEIDRKSLHMYKARLASAFRFEESKVYPEEEPNMPFFGWLDPQARWRTLTERHSDESRAFEAQLEYPEFRFDGVNAGPLNDFVREKICGTLRRFRNEVVYSDRYPSTIGYELSSSFAVALLQSDLASIRFGFHAYTGGAHGNAWAETVNAFLDPFASFGLTGVFINLSTGINVLSSYCVHTLLHPENQNYPRDEQWVNEGAGPQEGNFSRFNLTSQGLLISFDEYQIDCYAAGASELLVPYSVFTRNLEDRFRKALSIC